MVKIEDNVRGEHVQKIIQASSILFVGNKRRGDADVVEGDLGERANKVRKGNVKVACDKGIIEAEAPR